MSRTPARTTTAAENQATVDDYFEGWRSLNAALRAGEPWSGDERNAAFLNGGLSGAALDLADAAPVLGLDDPGDGRAAATLDVDFDGDDDLVVSYRTAPRLRIYANRLADDAPWLAVELRGMGPNTGAPGAVVFATPVDPRLDEAQPEASGSAEPVAIIPGRTLRRTRTIGSGYLAQSSSWLRFHFGSGDERARQPRARQQRVRLAVRWPDAGLVLEDFGEVRTGQRYRLQQGSGRAQEAPAPAAVAFAEGSVPSFETPAAGEAFRSRRLVLPAPSSIPSLAVRSLDGESVRLFGMTPSGPRGAGRPAIVVAWDSRVPSAIEDLGGIPALVEEAQAAGALLVAIDVAEAARDDEPDPLGLDPLRSGATRLQAAGFRGSIVAAELETAAILGELVAWRLDRTNPPSLPWSFVLGADGRLDVVRTGAWSEGDARADVAFCSTLGDQRASLATPYGGRWLLPPTEANVAELQGRLERAGAKGAVRELDLARVSTVAPGAAELLLRLGRSLLDRGDLELALERFDQAAESEPENALAHRARAYVLHRLARFEPALEAWTRALELEPADVPTRANRGLAAVAAGRLQEARADLDALEAAGHGGKAEVVGLKGAIVAAEGASGGSSK